jgi:ABC-type Fe3+-hydroxamate transport system substrate-binding protein
METNILSDPTSAFDTGAPRRVVSLVPSVTASLLDLSLGHTLVGITDYCPMPPPDMTGWQRVGGVKDPHVEQIRAMEPDLVIANREENSREAVEALAAAGIRVWLTFPTTVRAAIDDLWNLANIFRNDIAMRQVAVLETGMEWAELAAQSEPSRRYFCPIWQELSEAGNPWWMTFNRETYSHDVLRIFRGENVFADRDRRYPLLADLGQAPEEPAGDRDTRYPHVSLQEILAAQPEVILLPSEPFDYGEAQAAEVMNLLAETPAVKAGRVFLFDGTLITWYGTRLARALDTLPNLFLY